MKPSISNRQTAALTLVEVVVVASLAVLVIPLLPALASAKKRRNESPAQII